MAINTAAKRNSAIATRRLPWMRRFAPIPGGSITASSRQQVAWSYAGIASSMSIGSTGWFMDFRPRRREVVFQTSRAVEREVAWSIPGRPREREVVWKAEYR